MLRFSVPGLEQKDEIIRRRARVGAKSAQGVERGQSKFAILPPGRVYQTRDNVLGSNSDLTQCPCRHAPDAYIVVAQGVDNLRHGRFSRATAEAQALNRAAPHLRIRV